ARTTLEVVDNVEKKRREVESFIVEKRGGGGKRRKTKEDEKECLAPKGVWSFAVTRVVRLSSCTPLSNGRSSPPKLTFLFWCRFVERRIRYC
ncbi:13876_t:CDS:2, partial [Acaulospora colombiana]